MDGAYMCDVKEGTVAKRILQFYGKRVVSFQLKMAYAAW